MNKVIFTNRQKMMHTMHSFMMQRKLDTKYIKIVI